MSTTNHCPQCGAGLTADAPAGLCPQCLLKQGLGSEPGVAPGGGTVPVNQPHISAHTPPTPVQLAKFFPQLEVLELLGQGGMGMVYKARQPQLDRLVALKLLPSASSRDPAFAQRFAQEARSLARLNHPNIVAVYDFGQTDGFFYFLMEFVDGVNLRQMLRWLSPREALTIVPQVCEALQFAHDEGVVHRDIKPENILVDKKGRVKIADFGLARLLGEEAAQVRLTQTQQVMGTPHYMAPEQMESSRDVDHRADIYSLGVVFYEMLTGELPLGRFAPPSKKVEVDVRLDEVVLRSLENDPQLRYQNASEVKSDIESISGIVDRLTPQMRGMLGYEYRSKTIILGLPLVHFAVGIDPATGRKRVAKGIIAVGDVAKGVFAFGGMAFGGIACGGVGVGVISISGCALGLISIGGAALGLLLAFGGLAIAPVALGGAAVGYYACGGGAWGVHPYGGNAHDANARAFFNPWAANVLKWWTRSVPFVVMIFVGLGFLPALMWRQARRTQAAAAASPSKSGMPPRASGPGPKVAVPPPGDSNATKA